VKYNEYLSNHSALKSCAKNFLPGYLEEISIITYLDFYLFCLTFLFLFKSYLIPIHHFSDLTTLFITLFITLVVITHARITKLSLTPTAPPLKVRQIEHAPNCSLEYVLTRHERLIAILVPVTRTYWSALERVVACWGMRREQTSNL